MPDRHDVIICMRCILLDVVMPEEHVREFIEEFSKAFVVEDNHKGAKNPKVVYDYYENPAHWHIQVSVGGNDEGRFSSFLQDFCSKRQLSFCNPKAQPVA